MDALLSYSMDLSETRRADFAKKSISCIKSTLPVPNCLRFSVIFVLAVFHAPIFHAISTLCPRNAYQNVHPTKK